MSGKRPGHTVCGECQQPMDKAVRVFQGVGYCSKCLWKHFINGQCTRCQCNCRVKRGSVDPLCSDCECRARWEGKPCARCGGVNKPFGLVLPDGRISCLSCKPYMLDPKPCFYCGTLSHILTRDLLRGVEEPACGPCRYDLGQSVCCDGCHRPRVIVGDRDGKPLCKDCLPTGKPPLIECRDCKKTKPHFGDGRCDDCAWARIHSRLLRRLGPQVPSLWARELMDDYYRLLRNHVRHGTVSFSLRRDVVFFAALAKHFNSKSELNGVLLIRKLGHETARKHSRAISFLSASGVIVTRQDPDYELEWHLSRIRELCTSKTPWIASTLDQFLGHILDVRDRFKQGRARKRVPVTPKSIESAVRSACTFLEFARKEGAGSVHEISQDHLELFLAAMPIQRLRVRAFARFMRRRKTTFQKLKMPRFQSEFSLKNVLSEEQRAVLLKALLKVTEVQDLRWSVVALFALLYIQPPHKSVQLKLSQVRATGDGYQVHFAKHWIDLDEGTAKVLARWLACRREHSCFEKTGDSEFLFPGKLAGTHVRADSMSKWIQQFKVSKRNLAVTSLVSWITNGVKHPKVLADAFGMSSETAVRYCEQLGTMISDEARGAYQSA